MPSFKSWAPACLEQARRPLGRLLQSCSMALSLTVPLKLLARSSHTSSLGSWQFLTYIRGLSFDWIEEVFIGYVAFIAYPGAQFHRGIDATPPRCKGHLHGTRSGEVVVGKAWSLFRKTSICVLTMRYWIRYLDVTRVGRWKNCMERKVFQGRPGTLITNG